MGRMPAHRLIDSAGPAVPVDDLVQAVHAVLAGRPLGDTASKIGTNTAQLAEAIETYDAAGRRALEKRPGTNGWWQFYVRFPDWSRAEDIATEHLTPLIDTTLYDEPVPPWWFIRKHPCWRIRVHAGQHGEHVRATIGTALDELVAAGHLSDWCPGIYEPESAAFGGAVGMAVAHQLFHADSQAIWYRFGRTDEALGRRELSVILCTTFLQASSPEWYEQGDVWDRVAAERPLPDATPPEQLYAMTRQLRPLLLANTEPNGPLFDDRAPLGHATYWAAAFRNAGTDLRALNDAGTLDRGLRQIAAYHVIFHWNRLGLSWRTQSLIANTAKTAIFDPPVDSAHRPW